MQLEYICFVSENIISFFPIADGICFEFATYIIKVVFLSPCRYFVMNKSFGILTFRGIDELCFFEMYEFQITRKQLQFILAQSSIMQAQSVVVLCVLTSYDVFGNFRTANNLEHFIRVKLFLKISNYGLFTREVDKVP